MDVAQQFCLKWNNYHSTVNSIYHKLFLSGTFVDVSLIIDDKKINCHKIVLSACSIYFEKLLTEHNHPHPLIVLHDVPFSAVESLVVFMYKGEINVGHDQLDEVLKVAAMLKVKGLADSPAIGNFTRMRHLNSDFQNLPNLAQQFYPAQYLQESLLVPLANNTNTVNIPLRDTNSPSSAVDHYPPSFHALLNNHMKRSKAPSSLVLPKKRARHDLLTSSLPPSPPSSRGDPHGQELMKVQPHQEKEQANSEIKTEAEEETDNELQIDESGGQSPEESAVESDSMSSRNTPELDPQEQREREETAQSLAALAQGTINFLPQTTRPPPPQLMLAPKINSMKVKEEKTGGHGGGKNGEKMYTTQDLEEGIEQVISGNLTPAKAIAKYKVPRRTFFRRLSAVRKLRGIPSSKENASENYIRNHSNGSNIQGNGNHSYVPSGLVQGNVLNLNKSAGKLTNNNADVYKKEVESQPFISAGNVFSMFNAAQNNFDINLRYLKLIQDASIDAKHIKKETTIDGNSNISTSENSDQALALVTQNGT